MQDQYVLPLVDISKMQSPHLADRLEVAAALDQACKDVGFLYLKGISLILIMPRHWLNWLNPI